MLSAILLWLQSNLPGHGYVVLHAGLLPQLSEIIAIPSISILAIYYLKAASEGIAPWYEDAVDFGEYLAVLGTVASGSVFTNDKIHENWGDWVAFIAAILVVNFCIVRMGKLAKIRRWDNTPKARKNVFLGLAAIGIVSFMLSQWWLLDCCD